jgi:DNA-3-methyladenine glycosylase
MKKSLNFLHEDVVLHAKSLLGAKLECNIKGAITSGIIVETEAYCAPDDRACHAFGNRFTERTKTMFERGGVSYVYLCYGMYPLFNVVTGPKGMAHAVLIRAIEPVEGIDTMIAKRNQSKNKYDLCNGPGKLSMALGINISHNGIALINSDSAIQIHFSQSFDDDQIQATPRIGMSKRTGSCAHRLWRYYIKGNPWVSKPLQLSYPETWQ